MGCPGLEPGTDRLKAEYSTIEFSNPVINNVTCIHLFLQTEGCHHAFKELNTAGTDKLLLLTYWSFFKDLGEKL